MDIGVEKDGSRLMLASTTAHELFHAKSYKAARLDESGKIRLYRSGISMVDRKDPNAKKGEEKEYFGKMEEAIVAECTKKFLQKIESDPFFKDETVAISKIKKWAVHYLRSNGVPEDQLKMLTEEIKYIPNPQASVQQILAAYADEGDRSAYAAGVLHRLVEEKKVEPMERYRERKMLDNLLGELVVKSNGEFKDKETIFKEFAKAHFTGYYFTIAHIIERILGEGSFRQIANRFAAENSKNVLTSNAPPGFEPR